MTNEKTMIVSNQVECLKCGDKPFSKSRHDFVSCTCGAVSVDGGQAYLKRNFLKQDDYREMSIVLPIEQVLSAVATVKAARESGRNDLGLALAAIRGLRDGGMVFERAAEENQ